MSEPFYIKVKVKTKQKNESAIQTNDNTFEISLKEKPERGLANKRILEIINKHYKYPEGGVTIINGQQSPIKLLRVGR
jgi:uncharacterized protein YggU (UPF0235/DUF167 family)